MADFKIHDLGSPRYDNLFKQLAKCERISINLEFEDEFGISTKFSSYISESNWTPNSALQIAAIQLLRKAITGELEKEIDLASEIVSCIKNN